MIIPDRTPRIPILQRRYVTAHKAGTKCLSAMCCIRSLVEVAPVNLLNPTAVRRVRRDTDCVLILIRPSARVPDRRGGIAAVQARVEQPSSAREFYNRYKKSTQVN